MSMANYLEDGADYCDIYADDCSGECNDCHCVDCDEHPIQKRHHRYKHLQDNVANDYSRSW